MPIQNVDLTVIVTAHAEGRLLLPTLRSIENATNLAAQSGIRSEVLVVLDNPSRETAQHAESWAELESHDFLVRLERISVGESGASRNVGVAKAQGATVALVDGDDLVSSNYFTSAVKRLDSFDGVGVVHPEVVISFGARPVYWKVPESLDPELSYIELVERNLWPSSLVARRTTLKALPYLPLHPENGFGPEDWYWNILSMSQGVQHLTAPSSVFFYRVRERGGVNNRHALSILPRFDLESLKQSFPARQRRSSETGAIQAIGPKSVIQLVARRSKRIIGTTTRWLHPDLRARALHRAGLAYQRTLGISIELPKHRSIRLTLELAQALTEVCEIEPAVSWTATQIEDIPEWRPTHSRYAVVLTQLLAELKDVEAIVAVPWLGIGGADMVSINYARALDDSPEYHGKVAILACHDPNRTRPELVPVGVQLVQIPAVWRELSPDDQARLFTQLILILEPQLVISVNCFDMTNALARFSRQLTSSTRVYLTLFAWDKIGSGFPTNPITDDAQRDFLDDVSAILTDNANTARLIQERLGLDERKVIVHRQPVADVVPALANDRTDLTLSMFSPERPFRIIWPHRIDREKRPDVLLRIAEECRFRNLPVQIEIWGQRVLHAGDADPLPNLFNAGVRYRGPYQGGLFSIDTSEYDALLLTSESEGLPLVLVQSLMAGLPVVASDVGGVGDIIQHDSTGLLVSPFDDSSAYVDAIERLISSADLRQSIIRNGYAFAAENHSRAGFAEVVRNGIIQAVPMDAS